MLADVNLAELPDIALVALRAAISGELRRREQYRILEKEQAQAERRSLTKVPPPKIQHSTLPARFPISALAGSYKKRLVYLPRLLAQDWTALFPESDTVATEAYVYSHCDPRGKPIDLKSLQVTLKGKPFYIGKGTGRRAWDLKRNQGHAKKIEHIRRLGYEDESIVQVVCQNLTEQQALILEAKLIYFFGSIYDENTEGCLLNLADHSRPTFFEEMDDWQSEIQEPFSPKQTRRKLINIQRDLSELAEQLAQLTRFSAALNSVDNG